MFRAIIAWWRGANSSNILMFVVVSLLASIILNTRKDVKVEEAKVEASAEVIRSNDAASMEQLDRLLEDQARLEKFKRALNENDSQFTNQRIPDDIVIILQSAEEN